jgi:predicted RNA binding protein YcfA (HicA-like mRNA interferase family)
MPRFPRVSGKKISKILISLGFKKFRQRGSHMFFVHEDGRVTTITDHENKEIPIGTLKAILKDIEILDDDFRKLL